MKRFPLIVLGCAVATAAAAADAPQSLAPVAVQARRSLDCTPPSDASECKTLHAQIRQTFTPEEIGMLFGSATASLKYPTSYAAVKKHYADFIGEFENANGVAIVVVGDPVKP